MAHQPVDDLHALGTRFFDALRGRDWATAVTLSDPGELVASRERQLEQLLTHEGQSPDDLPPEEYIRRFADPWALLPELTAKALPPFDGVGTVGELVALTPPRFAAYYLGLREHLYGELSRERMIAGVLRESPTLAHIAYRLSPVAPARSARIHRMEPPDPAWAVRVLSARVTDGQWRVLYNGEIAGDWVSWLLEELRLQAEPARSAG